MAVVCTEFRTFWELELMDFVPRRPRALSEPALEFSEEMQECCKCSCHEWEGSTCAEESDTCSEAERSSLPASWADTEDEIEAEWRTTIVLRQLPTSVTRDDVLAMLDQSGFKHLYDFFYLPTNFKKSRAFGYVMVNFVKAADAERAVAVFQGSSYAERTILAEWSEAVQGLEALVAKYRSSKVMAKDIDDKHQPMLFERGVRVAFPQPVEEASSESSVAPVEKTASTLIVRGLSKEATVSAFLDALDSCGFAEQYDFAYVPRNFTKGTAFGFAVLNFINEDLAAQAFDRIAKGCLVFEGSVLTSELSESCSGFDNLLNKYRNNKVMQEGIPESYRPVVFVDGERVPFASC